MSNGYFCVLLGRHLCQKIQQHTRTSGRSHPNVREAVRQLPRDKVVVMTKSDTRDPAGLRRDLDRYRRELGIEMIDIVLIHCVTEADWTTRYRGAMDVLSEAKHKGVIRAHGCSCHTIEALRAAAASPWVDIDLVRLNPIGSHMDADPSIVISEIKKMRSQGKGIVGMKILGQGDLRDRPAEAIRYALSTGVLDAFTIGAESRKQQDNLTQRIAAA
ncbi:MAG: aldo/keto reductase [Edaphobacter sp.]|uniref:aldo/keto reductase n=1 Tax=Edaphobacter sp. TaxID=1934404 RepID=UPI00238A7134|nr:aldo/keto reductase [Edaphobacter sp.]MDE1176344.1 aldo/keto reductase [Edaphobacter sp.]